MELLQTKVYLYPPEDYTSFILAYNNVFQSGYLYLRLTSTKLIEVTNIIIDNIEEYVYMYGGGQFTVLFKVYINLIVALCSGRLHNNREYILNECKKRIPFLEYIKYRPGTTEEYIHFYSHILSYKEFLDEETSKLYYARLLSKIDRSGLNCMVVMSVTTCDYFHFASSYYYLGDYEKSADFLEKALVENNPSSLDCLKISRNVTSIIYHAGECF